ncbi:heme biosynthesis HemY N-terminal domain-containing protein [Streptomyces tailanensis]|uniref:heme biosynthesis HemY N-terminal domain-containing protein n=1 Tax=Streptomyces tailanensis TaxID=2569858 RepID=UPI00122DE9AA|nr:heme biosynthesis HemY N-terminal domain-containing protein [Streptomyces tailanensis]
MTGDSSRLLDSRHRMVMHLRKGLKALAAGRRADAERHLGEAAAAAHRSGEGWVLAEIEVYGEVHDAAAGSVSVRLPADTHRVSVTLLRLGARSAAGTTGRTSGRQRPAGPCPVCEETPVPGALYCTRCGEGLS